jgi:hypothetical protein
MDHNKILAIILVIVVVWIYLTWSKSEPFEGIPKSVHWGQNEFYPIDGEYYPVPAISNYSSKNYQLPLAINQEYENNNTIPIAHNTPQKTPDVSSINQAGAPLDEVYSDEASILKDILPDEIVQTLTSQQHEINDHISQGPSAYMKPTHEESLNLPQDNNQDQEESLIHELPHTEEHVSEEQVTKVFMPELGQRQKIEESQYEEQVLVNVKPANYNLSLAILLSVVLVGFAYQTR